MRDFQVTPEMLAAGALSCQQTAQFIDDRLSALRSYIVSLESEWQGVAKTTFDELMRNYDVYARMMHNSLTDIGSGLRGNMVNYVDAEGVNVRQLAGVDGHAMPGQAGSSFPAPRF
jgi:WXG100 family type VII secretion target